MVGEGEEEEEEAVLHHHTKQKVAEVEAEEQGWMHASEVEVEEEGERTPPDVMEAGAEEQPLELWMVEGGVEHLVPEQEEVEQNCGGSGEGEEGGGGLPGTEEEEVELASSSRPSRPPPLPSSQ